MDQTNLQVFFTVQGTNIGSEINAHFYATFSESVVLSSAPILVSTEIVKADLFLDRKCLTPMKITYVVIPKLQIINLAKIYLGELEPR